MFFTHLEAKQLWEIKDIGFYHVKADNIFNWLKYFQVRQLKTQLIWAF